MMLITMRILCEIIPKTAFLQLRIILGHRVLVAMLPILEDLTIMFECNMSRT